MAEKTIHLKRTSLYASGASPVNMIQAIFYNEDMLIYDLEDSVPAVEKDAARFLVYNMVKNHRPKDKYVCIRVNGIYSEYLEEDLQAAVRANPDCIRIPKVEYAREVQDISRRIAAIEEKIGLEVGKIELICNIESYMGVINAMEIAHSDPRVVAMAVSAEDLTASLKAQRTKKGLEVFYARNAVLMHAVPRESMPLISYSLISMTKRVLRRTRLSQRTLLRRKDLHPPKTDRHGQFLLHAEHEGNQVCAPRFTGSGGRKEAA